MGCNQDSDVSGHGYGADMTDMPNTPPADKQIVNAIANFMTERAESGVLYARALSSLACQDGIVTAVFDPAKAGATTETFCRVNNGANMAEFVGVPAAFDDTVGQWLRQSLVRVDTELADGSSLGSMTAGELHRLATEIIDGE